MSKIEDFENAPIGATATHANGSRAMKMDYGKKRWISPGGSYYSDEEMAYLDYTLDPSVPTTAREALALAWALAHEVKPGQTIPEGTRFLEFSNSVLKEYTAYGDREINFAIAPTTRTLEPLPEPEPDWIDAPAVIAVCNDTMDRDVFVRRGDNSWRSEFYGAGTADLRDVVPLYPEEEDGEWVSL